MFEGGVYVPALRFTQRRARFFDLFDAIVDYAVIVAILLAILYGAIFYDAIDLSIDWLRAVCFCCCIIAALGQIWSIFYQSQRIRYGYSEKRSYHRPFVLLRLATCGGFLWLTPYFYADFASYWAHISLRDDPLVIAIAVWTIIMIIAMVIYIPILIFDRVSDQRFWRIYIDSEYGLDEKAPTFAEYCQKFSD